MSHYQSDSSLNAAPVPPSPGARPLSGAGLEMGGVPGVHYQPPMGDMGADSYSENELERGGGQRDSLRAMGDMLKSGPPQGQKDKKGKSKFPKPPSLNVRGSFKKVKGVFKRGSKDQEPLQHAPSREGLEIHEQAVLPESGVLDLGAHTSGAMIEDTGPGSGYATPQPFDHHPGGYDINPPMSPTQKEPPGKMGAMKSSVKNWFYPTVPAAGPTRGGGDVAELRQLPPPPPLRMSNVIYCLLILGIVIGILLTAMSSRGQHYAIVGPLLLGLSAFALLGKIFFTLFWLEEPCPKLRPYITKMEDVFGGARDPYKHKQSTQSRPSHFMPPISPTAKDTLPMQQFTYNYTYPVADAPPPPSYAGPAATVGYQPTAFSFDRHVPPNPDSSMEEAPFAYGDKPTNGETIDTRMRTGKSPEPFAKEYEGADMEGYTGPAGRSTPTYLN